jgi:UDP-glucuronate decarboxylase
VSTAAYETISRGGGAGFIGSHLCERLLERRHDVLCVDNFFTGSKRNMLHLLGNPRFELMRHDVTFPALCRGRRDLQPRLPGLAGALPARPGADDQDQRARRHQHAGPGQAGEGADPAGLDQRGLRRPDRAPAARELLGQRQSDRPRACYDEGKRCAETLFFDYHRQHGLRIKVVRHLQHLRPAHAPERRARRLSNFIVQALRGEPITIYGDGTQTRSFCYVDDLVDGSSRSGSRRYT